MRLQRGFTLIEMAIVLVIITILIGGLAVPLSAQIQARRIAETNKTLEEARDALLGYAMSHQTAGPTPRPYLPCPDLDADGIEEPRVSGACIKDSGWYPWVTLGTAAQDAWGNRLRYAAHADLTNRTTGFHNGTTPAPSTPWFQVCSANGCPAVDVAADVPVVVLSYGPNGWGARNVNGNTLANPTSANELENQDTDDQYVSRPPTKPDNASGEFDDLTTWLAFNVIINRVCPAGGCP